MTTQNPILSPLAQFFQAFGSGDVAGIKRVFHAEVAIIADGPASVPWYGQYHGAPGVDAFLTALGSNIEPQHFDVHTMLEQAPFAVAAGTLIHRIPATGKEFASDWALVCTIQDDQIIRYQFFENTAAAVDAFQPVVATPATP